MDGKSIALQLGRARDASLCSLLVFNTTFFGINRSLASQRIGSLIRPLLSISRNDVKKLCRFWGLPIYPDVTNQTVAFSRNRIRKQLLPALRVALNPQVDSVLSQSAEIMFAERLQQDLLALKVLRAYEYVPKFDRGRPGEKEGNQPTWEPCVMERQRGQRSTGPLVGHMKPRLRWKGVRWPFSAIEGDGVLQLVEQNIEPLGGLPKPRVPWNREGAPQRPREPKKPLTSVDMSIVRADYGRTLAVKPCDLQVVWFGFGFGKTGAILDAKNPCNHQKQCIRLLHKRRGCLFLPQVGIFFTNSISPPCQCYSKFFK